MKVFVFKVRVESDGPDRGGDSSLLDSSVLYHETYDTLYCVLSENDQLRAKIEGLNEEYAKIGLEVFNAFSDNVFTGIEKLIAIRHEIKANESE